MLHYISARSPTQRAFIFVWWHESEDSSSSTFHVGEWKFSREGKLIFFFFFDKRTRRRFNFLSSGSIKYRYVSANCDKITIIDFVILRFEKFSSLETFSNLKMFESQEIFALYYVLCIGQSWKFEDKEVKR